MTTEERLLDVVNAGKLKTRVTLMDPETVIDNYGNRSRQWLPGATVWAYIEQHSSQIYTTTGEAHIVRKSIIAIRYRSGVTADTRYMAAGNRLYKPEGAPIDACGCHRVLYVECVEELKADG